MGAYTWWALKSQRDLQVNEPISNTLQLGSHNAYNSKAYGAANIPLVAPNQIFSLADQLDAGARVLELDLWLYNGGIVLNHNQEWEPNPIGINPSAPVIPIVEALDEIRGWVDANSSEVIFLHLENHTGLEDRQWKEPFQQVLGSLGDDGSRLTKTVDYSNQTIYKSRAELLAEGIRVEYFEESGTTPTQDFSMEGEEPDLGYLQIVYGDGMGESGNDEWDVDPVTAQLLTEYARNAVNVVRMDFFLGQKGDVGWVNLGLVGGPEKAFYDLPDGKRGDLLKAAVWSWAEGDPGATRLRDGRIGILGGGRDVVVQDAKTLLGQDWGWFTAERWRSVSPDSGPYPFALRSVHRYSTKTDGSLVRTDGTKGDYFWQESMFTGRWGDFVNIPADELYLLKNGHKVKDKSGEDIPMQFAGPVNGLENWKLYESRTTDASIWLGVQDLDRDGNWSTDTRFTFVSLDGHKNLIVQDLFPSDTMRVQGRIDDLSIRVADGELVLQQGTAGTASSWARHVHNMVTTVGHYASANEVHVPLSQFSGQILVRTAGCDDRLTFLAGSGSPGLTVVYEGGNGADQAVFSGEGIVTLAPGVLQVPGLGSVKTDGVESILTDGDPPPLSVQTSIFCDAEGNLVVYDPAASTLSSELQIVIDSERGELNFRQLSAGGITTTIGRQVDESNVVVSLTSFTGELRLLAVDGLELETGFGNDLVVVGQRGLQTRVGVNGLVCATEGLHKIRINAGAGADVLLVDPASEGLVQTIIFDGGAGANTVVAVGQAVFTPNSNLNVSSVGDILLANAGEAILPGAGGSKAVTAAYQDFTGKLIVHDFTRNGLDDVLTMSLDPDHASLSFSQETETTLVSTVGTRTDEDLRIPWTMEGVRIQSEGGQDMLTMELTDQSDSARVNRQGAVTRIELAPCSGMNGLVFEATGVEKFCIDTRDGDDTLEINADSEPIGDAVTIQGGEGVDTIAAMRDAGYLKLGDSSLWLDDLGWVLLQSVEQASLSAGAGQNEFIFSEWTGTVTAAGGGGDDRYTFYPADAPGQYTLVELADEGNDVVDFWGLGADSPALALDWYRPAGAVTATAFASHPLAGLVHVGEAGQQVNFEYGLNAMPQLDPIVVDPAWNGEGETFYQVRFVEVGGKMTLAARIDWGDGSEDSPAEIVQAPGSVEGLVTGSHAYPAGTRRITVTVDSSAPEISAGHVRATVFDESEIDHSVLSVDPTEIAVAAVAGATVQIPLTVGESGGETSIAAVVFSCTDLVGVSGTIPCSAVTFDAQSFHLAPGASRVVIASIPVPAEMEGEVSGTITVSSANTAEATIPVSLMIVGSEIPTINITETPDYGSDGLLHGLVTGVDFATHQLATYIYVDGSGWWTKPTFAEPAVAIGPDGSFAVDVVSGGLDAWATIFCTAVLPDDVTIPIADGDGSLPAELASLAVAIDFQQRYGRTIEFAGYTWAVKEAVLPVGPGLNRFSSDEADVWVDEEGLHLTVNFHDGQWWSSEVVLLDSLGYGTYAIQTDSRNDILDANAVFGAFTWDPYGDDEAIPGWPYREIDIEDSRWGEAASSLNSQFVVQPWEPAGHRHQYTLPDLGDSSALTRFFNWQPLQIEFAALAGYYSADDYPTEAVIDEWTFSHDADAGLVVPEPGREQFRLNLWLSNTEPAEGETVEVVIRDFTHLSAGGPCQINEGEDLSLDASSWLGTVDANVAFAWDLDDDGEYDDANDVTTTVPWSTLAGLGLASDGSPLPIHVRASDEETVIATGSTTLTINNLVPNVDAGGPYTVGEGGTVQLDAGGSTDPGGDALTYGWDFDGDGQYDDAVGATPNFSAAGLDGPTSVTVWLQVTDDGGASDTAAVELTVTNVAPTADIGGSYTVAEGGIVQLDASGSTDPGSDVLTYAWDLDNDGEHDDAVGATPVFSAAGLDGPTSVTIRLQVTDDDGASDVTTITITVTNVAPTADIGGPYTVTEGGTVQLDAGGSTDPGGDTLTYEWDFDGDGQYDDAVGATPDFSVAGLDGPMTVTVGLAVIDDDGVGTSATVEISVTQPQPIDLGTVDFSEFSELALPDGNVWYRLTAARSGQLTAIASAAAGSASVNLYDSWKTVPPLAVSSAMEGVERLDHAVEAGTTYFLRIAGSSTDAALTIANLVTTAGTEVMVFGTDGADAFEFAATGSYTVTIKGVEYHFDDAVYETIVFNGGLGDDSAALTGGAGAEVARFYPDHGTFGENGFLVTVNDTSAITAHSGGEGDLAFMYDSPGDDEFIARKGYGKLSGDGFSLETFDFMVTYGYATTRDGGNDVAYMEDTPGADKFKFDWPNSNQFFGKMYGGGDYFNRAKNFERIVATMTDGKDTVRLFDSTGNDTFFGQKAESRLIGPGYDVTVSGYDSLIAYASKGTDAAHLQDSEDDDTTRARPHKVILWGGDDTHPTYEITARKFDEYHFEAKNGGYNRAKLHDTIFSDHVGATGDTASFYRNDGELGLLYEVVAFDWVKLYATDNDGHDTVKKEDPIEFELIYDEGLWEEVP